MKKHYQQFATRDDWQKFWKYKHLGWNVHMAKNVWGLVFFAAIEPHGYTER